jgi:hypothetical protein
LQLSLNNHFSQLLEAKVFKLPTESKIKACSSVSRKKGIKRKPARLGKENQMCFKYEVAVVFPGGCLL